MTLTFTYQGQERTLSKHPVVAAALKAGRITPAQASAKRWFLRLTQPGSTRELRFKLPAGEADAIRAAKDILRGRTERPDQFSAWLEEQAAKRGVTLGTLAAAWFAAGLPHNRTRPRQPAAAARLRATTQRALTYWHGIAVLQAPQHFQKFAADRMAQARSGSGRRTADIQLSAMSCLCRWAVLEGRIHANPFDTTTTARDPFVISGEIRHCHEFMPESDEQFHALLARMFSGDQRSVVAGAWLCFGALTGLRPHEPGHLLRVPRAAEFPTRLKDQPPGLIYPMPDGTAVMKVQRGKGGQNPHIRVHPNLADFLQHWTMWLQTHIPLPTLNPQPSTTLPLFPCHQEDLAPALRAAAQAIGAREQHPHGFMRAYYVRVRKSQGADPATVAAELGQTSGGSLIRSVYGDPQDPIGGNLYDWHPKTGAPAWHTLTAARAHQPQNIIAIA